MKTAIYIPTHHRQELCKKLYDSLQNFKVNIPIYLVMDKNQNVDFEGYNVISPEKDNNGISYARNFIIKHADSVGYTHILIIDDDIILRMSPIGIFERFNEDSLLGQCGLHFRFNEWNEIHQNTGLQYAYSVCCLAVALDVKKVLEVGNYDLNLKVNEDQELSLRLMMNGFYKAIDTNIEAHSGKINNSGGCSSEGQYLNNMKESTNYINKKYNFNCMRRNPRGTYSFMWVKMKKSGFFPKIDWNKINQYQRKVVNKNQSRLEYNIRRWFIRSENINKFFNYDTKSILQSKKSISLFEF